MWNIGSGIVIRGSSFHSLSFAARWSIKRAENVIE